jgi:outer membrane protein assembly factor BamE (lipoprotein component of BamABCDE complex)
MRVVLGAVSLLLVLGVVSLLVKKQIPQGTVQTPQQPSQNIQQEVKQQVEAALQQPRTTADEK